MLGDPLLYGVVLNGVVTIVSVAGRVGGMISDPEPAYNGAVASRDTDARRSAIVMASAPSTFRMVMLRLPQSPLWGLGSSRALQCEVGG